MIVMMVMMIPLMISVPEHVAGVFIPVTALPLQPACGARSGWKRD
jgi:hypothetical protein